MKGAEAFIRFRLFVFHQAGNWVANLRFRSLVRRNLPVFGVGLFLYRFLIHLLQSELFVESGLELHDLLEPILD